MVGLKFGLCVIANFENFVGLGIMDGYVVGVVTVVLWALFLHCYSSSYVFCLVAIFVLYSFICASERILFIDDEKVPKNPAKSMRATLACLFTCVCIAHVL